jgi:hypothetical protein
MSMPGVETSESELHERLTAILRATPPLMQVLSVARRLCLPDWLVFSGALYQPVLNHLTGRALDYGIKDYDLGYFDASRCAELFADLLRSLTAAPRLGRPPRRDRSRSARASAAARRRAEGERSVEVGEVISGFL